MLVACFDLEGVFLPEIWINVSKITGIEELSLTTKDIANYDELMTHRLKILKDNNISLTQIKDVINKIEPVEGALDFLRWLKTQCQFVILSDTFYEFADPLMDKLERPTLFCHNLIIENDMIENYSIRVQDHKRKAVNAFKQLNFTTFACGDSYNDVGMIEDADHSCFFRAPVNILSEYPKFKGVYQFDDLKNIIIDILKGSLT
jgi:phosphoserine / homoserine phosphotransferase